MVGLFDDENPGGPVEIAVDDARLDERVERQQIGLDVSHVGRHLGGTVDAEALQQLARGGQVDVAAADVVVRPNSGAFDLLQSPDTARVRGTGGRMVGRDEWPAVSARAETGCADGTLYGRGHCRRWPESGTDVKEYFRP